MGNSISGIKFNVNKPMMRTGGLKGDKFKLELSRIKNEDKKSGGDIAGEKIRRDKINEVKEISTEKLSQSSKMLKSVFENLDAGHKRIESILKVSLSGVKLSQQELLTLQMRVYRFTQEVELISKLVEKGTSGIKQVVNTQI